MGSYLGDMLRVLELAVLYYDTSSPLEKGGAKGAGWILEEGILVSQPSPLGEGAPKGRIG